MAQLNKSKWTAIPASLVRKIKTILHLSGLKHSNATTPYVRSLADIDLLKPYSSTFVQKPPDLSIL